MSDILIRGIEMPTGCGALTLNVWPDGQVEIIDADGEWKTAEAIPVPPHGRLGDLDVLVEKAWDADTRCGYVQVVDVGDILDAPTIIPAEEGKT